MRGIKLPAIERPNGKLYRPRTITPVCLGNEDEITDILVFGTHDVRYAEIIAAPELECLAQDFYHGEARLEISGPGKQVWKNKSLSAWDDGAPIYCYAENPETGRAGVMFPLKEVPE